MLRFIPLPNSSRKAVTADMIEIPRPSKLTLTGTFERKLENLVAYLERLVDALRKNIEYLESKHKDANSEQLLIKAVTKVDDELVISRTDGAFGKIDLSSYAKSSAIPIIENGTVAVENVSNTYVNTRVNFNKVFSSAPIVIIFHAGPSANRFIYRNNITTDGFDLKCYCINGTATVTVGWAAIGY